MEKRTAALDLQGVRIKALSNGLTERQLLSLAGMSPTFLSRHRRSGENADIDSISKIAEALNCDPQSLILKEKNKPQTGARIEEFKLDTEAIKRKAREMKMSERDLVLKAGVNVNLISVARHKGRNTLAMNVIKIANILECDPLEIVITRGVKNAKD